MAVKSFAMSVSSSLCWFAHFRHLNLLCSFSLSVIPLHLLCTQQLQNWLRMAILFTPFLQTAQVNLPFTVTFLAFSLLVISFAFLTFTVSPFDSSAPFQASSLSFRHPNVSLSNVKSRTWNSSSGHLDIISLGSAFGTIINKGFNTEP